MAVSIAEDLAGETVCQSSLVNFSNSCFHSIGFFISLTFLFQNVASSACCSLEIKVMFCRVSWIASKQNWVCPMKMKSFAIIVFLNHFEIL